MAKRKRIDPFYIEVIAFVLLLFFLFATTGYQEGTAGKGQFCLLFIAMGLYALAQQSFIRLGKLESVKQLSIINFFFAITFLVSGIRGKADFIFWGRRSYLICCLAVAGVCFALCVQCFFCARKLFAPGTLWKKCVDRRAGIILIVVLGLAAFIDSSVEARWDGAYIYQYIHRLTMTGIFHVSKLSFCQHISMSYVALNKLASMVFGSTSLGMTVLNIGLYLGSVLCVYLILRKLFPKISDMGAALLTAVYACSPFLLGG